MKPSIFYTPNYVYTLQYRHTSHTISFPSGDMDYRQNGQDYNQARSAPCKECSQVDIQAAWCSFRSGQTIILTSWRKKSHAGQMPDTAQ